MALWKPDPTFYPSPRDAAAAPAGDARLRRRLRPGRASSRTRSPRSTSIPTPRRTDRWSAGPTCRTPATSCTTSAGTRARTRSARTRRTRTPSGATSSCRGCARPGSTILDTKDEPGPAAGREGAGGRRSWPSGPATPGRTPSTVDRKASTSELPRRRRTGRTGPAASRCSTTSSFEVLGRWEIDRGPQYLAYDALVAHRPGRRGHQRVGHAVDDRGRRRRRAAARPQVRARAALLGPAPAPARAGGRPRRRAPDGAGAAPGARPDQGVRVRRRGRQGRGPVRVGVALAPFRGSLGGHQGDHDPGRAGRRVAAAAGDRAVRRGAAAGHRHRPVRRRPVASTSRAGAPAS